MRKLLVLTLVIGMAALVGDWAGANAIDPDPADGTPTGVKYDWSGAEGELSLVGAPGSTYAVYDSTGGAVATGVLDANEVSFVAGNAGVGPDGVVVFVLVDGDVVAVTDPDWNWD